MEDDGRGIGICSPMGSEMVIEEPAKSPPTLGGAPLLDAPSRACLFVSSRRGPPHGWPFIVRRIDDALWCTTYADSAKIPWITKSDQATCLVFGDEHTVFPYVVIDGTVEVVRATPEFVSQWFGRPVDELGEIRVANRLLAGKRVFLVIRPSHPVLAFRSETEA